MMKLPSLFLGNMRTATRNNTQGKKTEQETKLKSLDHERNFISSSGFYLKKYSSRGKARTRVEGTYKAGDLLHLQEIKINLLILSAIKNSEKKRRKKKEKKKKNT